MLDHYRIVISSLFVLFSLLFTGDFGTPVAGPALSQVQKSGVGNEIASLEQQSQLSNSSQDIRLISSSSYKDSIGSLHVIGELQNTSPDPREYVKIVSTLIGPSDNILDTGFTYSEVEVLRPGEKSPFDVIFSNEQQVQMSQRYEISSITGDITQEKPANLKLNVGDSYYDSIGSAHVVGEVTNNGPGISHYTKISGTFYDDQNKTVATGFTYTDPNDLEPGQSAPFDMIISDSPANMASGSLNAQSSEYSMVLPAAELEMNGQSDGNSSSGFGSLGGGSINGSPDSGDNGDNGNGQDGSDTDDGGNDNDGVDNGDNDSGDDDGEDGSNGNDNDDGDGNSDDNNGEFFGDEPFF